MDPRLLSYGEVIGTNSEVIDAWLPGQNLREVLALEISRFKGTQETQFLLFDVGNLWKKGPNHLKIFRPALVENLEATASTPAIKNALKELSSIEELDESSLREITHWVLVYTLGIST